MILTRFTSAVWFFFQISYYNQASPEVLPYISTDIAGLSSSFYHTFCSCSQYLTENRLQSYSVEQAVQDQAINADGPAVQTTDVESGLTSQRLE